MTSPPVRIAIIGGGPSGLVTLKTLLESKGPDFNVEPVLFEAEEEFGGTFRYRAYANAQLVSSKQLTCFSDFRMPLAHTDHLTLPEYVSYLERYAEHFRLRERATVRMSTRVEHVERGSGAGASDPVDGKGGHWVTYRGKDGEQHREHFNHLCLCTGLHVVPAVPEIPGMPPVQQEVQEIPSSTVSDKPDELPSSNGEIPASSDGKPTSNSDGDAVMAKEDKNNKLASSSHLSPAQSRIRALHSSNYRHPSLFTNKRVLILGTGETGMDMAYEAVKAGASEIVLCTRAGFLMFPAVLADFVVFGVKFDGSLPIDGLITNLFETHGVHPWVAARHLRWHVSDFVIKRVLWVLTGTEAGCNQWVGELEPARLGRAYVFLNKSSKAMPYINRGWKNRPWLFERLASYLDPPTVLPHEPSVDLAPFPSHLTPDGRVIFQRNERKEDLRMRNRTVRPEVVVFATGYRQEFPFLDSSYPVPSDATCRDIIVPTDPSVSFIGFVRPGVGAIPPISEMQAQLWTLILRGKLSPPSSTPHYYLLVKEQARIKYGVDYSSYVAQLATDMGSQPSLRELWWKHGTLVLLTYCFGAAFPTFYRLTGPYSSPLAVEITRTELLETIKRRGVVGNLMMGVIPMAFYALVNLFVYAVEAVLRPFVRIARAVGGARAPARGEMEMEMEKRKSGKRV